MKTIFNTVFGAHLTRLAPSLRSQNRKPSNVQLPYINPAPTLFNFLTFFACSISFYIALCCVRKERRRKTARQRLQNYIDNLKNEGIMDGQYEETRRAQNSNFPNLMMNVIDNFLSDGDNSMRELADLLSARSVNYTKVTIAASLIKGGGSSLGGCRVAAKARSLLIASDNQDKQSCETSHERVVNEYYLFRDKLRTLHQLEREVFNEESRRRG